MAANITDIGDVARTNIRAPLPVFLRNAPLPHFPEYKKLISLMHSCIGHVVPYALGVPAQSPHGVLALLYRGYRSHGFSVLNLRLTKPRYLAPWSNWDAEAEERYAKAYEPGRYAGWTKDREETKARGPVKYGSDEVMNLRARLGQKQCRHSKQGRLCSDCEAAKRDMDDSLRDDEVDVDGEEWWDSDSSSDASCYDLLDGL
ncbi:hypothetical protein IAT38_000079 [Cryptococcus sp. DSM 104549]